jgi:hypothetical protein
MKNSNKLLWCAVSSMFGGVLICLVILKLAVPHRVTPAEAAMPQTKDTTPVTRFYDFKYFSAVRASGQWQLRLDQGDTYAVRVEMPAYFEPGVMVTKERDALRFKMASGWRLEGGELRAHITLPKLQELRLSGAVAARLLGFDTERLKIKASGATRISGKDNRIYYMSMDGSGAFDMDFHGNPVHFAEIKLSGSSAVDLTMAGGDLKGRISGSGRVRYDGDIRDQEVNISGSGSIKRVSSKR